MGDGAQIHIFGRRRIGAGAFQQRHLARAGRAQGLYQFVDFRQTRHAGGRDYRLAGFRNLLE